MKNQVGSIVQFSGNEWGVYCDTKADDKYSELWGISLLTAAYYARLYSMVKKDKAARHGLVECIKNPEMIRSTLADAMDGYTEFYKTNDVNLSYDLTRTRNPDRESSFIMAYDLEGHFAPSFRQKGFGFLGKNIEFGTVSACLATSIFFIDTHAQDEDYEAIVFKTISALSTRILTKEKLSIFDESRAVRDTVLEVMS